MNINLEKLNNNNEPNKNKKYKTSLIENETEKQQRLNKNVDLIKIKPLNNQNFNNKKKLPTEYIRVAKKLKKNNNSSLNDKTNNNNNNIKLSKKTHPKIKCCLINNINSDYPTKTNQNKNCVNISNSYNYITIDKEITSPKLIASLKPKLNVNRTYRAHHTQNFNSQIQFLNRTTDKILSSNNRPKVVFKSNGCKSIFLSKNIEYKGITDNLKNDQKINRIRNFKNFLHRKMDKKINRFNLREKLNENIYHRLFEQDSKEKLSINLIQNYIRKKF